MKKTEEYLNLPFQDSVLHEPSVAYQKMGKTSFEDDFNRAKASSMSIEEFRVKMHTFIRSLPWNER